MQDHVMMINTGQLPWSESPNSWSLPIGPDSNGRSLSIADYNQDGHADLLIGHSQGTISLYKNTSTVPVPLRVRVQPRYTGPSGAGTRVEATSPACASWNQPFEFTAGGALGGSSPQEIRISPPSDCSDPLPTIQLRVQWASGWVEFLSADAGEFVLFKEPEWLVVTGNDITLDAPPNSETVLILSDNVPVGPTTLNNNGQWTATFVDPQPGQQTRLSIMVDGKMLAIHPRQEWPSATKVHIRSFPQHLIEEQTVDFFMTLPELPDDSVAGLLVDGVSIEMQLNKEGNWAGMSPKLVPPTVTLQALVDGAPFGEPITQDVHPPFDLIFSRLRYEQLWYLEADLPLMTMSVVTELRDRNGALLDPNTTLVELIMNNKLQTPSVVLKQSEETIQGYPCKDFPDGASLEVRVNGQPWGPPQVFHHLASPPEIVAFVDPAHSRCSTAMSSMRADGQDIATVLLYLRDSHNNPIPHFGELPVPILDGVTLVPGSVHAGEQRYEFQIRAATQPGQAKISAALHTIPLGFNCYIDLWPAKPKTPLAVQSSHITAAPETLPINAPDPSEIGILPRQENGRLIGSNINLSATTSLGKLGEPVEYVGIGRYRTQLVSGAIAGSAHVAVLQDGVDTGLFTVVDFFDPDVPPEPEPSPDEGNSAEATESEPSPPVEEAVEEAGEDATDIRVDSMETDTAVTDTEPTPDVAVEPDTSPSNDSSNRSDTDTTPTADADTSRSPPDTTSSPDSTGPPRGDSSASLEDTADSGPATGVDAQIPSDDTEPRAEPDVSSTAPPKIASGGCSQGTRQPALPALCLLLALTLLLTRAQICEDSPGRTSACHTPPKEASTSTYRSKSSTN
jgi:hypothetical protein